RCHGFFARLGSGRGVAFRIGGGGQAQGFAHGLAVVEALVVKIIEQNGYPGFVVQAQTLAQAVQAVVVFDYQPHLHGFGQQGKPGWRLPFRPAAQASTRLAGRCGRRCKAAFHSRKDTQFSYLLSLREKRAPRFQ
nr:hypothetical protein [Tanacetum cinerariifolium]